MEKYLVGRDLLISSSLLLLYIILRRQWLAIAAMFVIALLIELSAFAAAGPRLFWIVSTLIALTIVTVVARFALLASMAHQLFFSWPSRIR